MGFLFKQTYTKSLEGVINHMYVQFQVMVKAKYQERRKDITVRLFRKSNEKPILALFAQMLCLNFSLIFWLGFLFKQNYTKSLEGVINHMYVQFKVMVKTKSQENKKDITAISSTYINKGSLTYMFIGTKILGGATFPPCYFDRGMYKASEKPWF